MSCSRAACAEDLALPLPVAVQPGLPGGVEELQRESLGAAGVRFVEVAGPPEVQHAPLPHREPVQVVRVLRQVVHEKALAQPAHGHHLDLLEAQSLHDHVEDGRSAHDDVCPVGVEPRHLLALFEGHSAQHRGHPAQLAAREDVTVLRFGPSPRRGRDGRQVPDGARGPYEQIGVMLVHLVDGMDGRMARILPQLLVPPRRDRSRRPEART